VNWSGLGAFILEEVTGKGSVYLTGSGNVVQRQLEAGETIRVPNSALVALEASMEYERVFVDGGLQNILFGRQGLFMIVIKGPGTVWVDSAPIDGLVREVASKVSKD